MSADAALISDNVESGQAKFDKNADAVALEPSGPMIGLTKEQLEKYRNDPFWKPVRLVLFALFWLAWVAMFAGAIAIVVFSPKCAEKKQSDWYQTKVSYQLLTPTFHDSDGDGVGDFTGISQKLDLLRKIGVTTVYPTPVIKIHKDELYNPYDIVDHLRVDERFGDEEDFKKLIEQVHDRDMYLVMDLPVSSVSKHHPWFSDPSTQDRFIWKSGNATGNNWHTAPNGKSYLGYPTADQPILNMKNAAVKSMVHDAIKKFLVLGVDGFHIDHVSRLAVDEDGNPDHDGAIAELKDLTADITKFAAHLDETKEKKIVLFSSLHDMEALHAKATETDLHYVIDTSLSKLSAESCGQSVAHCVHATLEKALDKYSSNEFDPYWQVSNADVSRLASRFDSATAELISTMQLTLPGALSVYYGQEMGLTDVNGSARGVMQWKEKGNDHHGFIADGNKNAIKDIFYPEAAAAGDDNEQTDNFEAQYGREVSPLKVAQKLAKMRARDEALVVGSTVKDAMVGETIVYSRYVKAENETMATGTAYVVALNFGSEAQSVDLTNVSVAALIPANKDLTKAEVAVATSGVVGLRARDKIDLSQPVLVPAKQGLVFRI